MNLAKCCACLLIAGVAGCSTLPSSGPTGSEILKSAENSPAPLPIEVVELTTPELLPAEQSGNETTFADLPTPPTDMVGPGDVMDIAIYEVGVALFGSSQASAATANTPIGFDPAARSQTLPAMRVDDDGYIAIPFAGKLHVLGKTVGEVAAQIRKSLIGLSQNPQVVVTLREAITNSVIIGGDVGRPGRLVLQTNRETLTDVIALAGGYRGEAKDLTVRVQRNSQDMELRVGKILTGAESDIRIYPGDKVTVVKQPLTYTVLGASGKVDRMPFATSSMTLAEAIGSAGGVSPYFGDPKAVFLFRYVGTDAAEQRPTVYHLNMQDSRSYFLAQRFEMQDQDLLYFGNAQANQPSKVLQLISQLFTPILTITAAVQTVQNTGN